MLFYRGLAIQYNSSKVGVEVRDVGSEGVATCQGEAEGKAQIRALINNSGSEQEVVVWSNDG